MGMNQRRGRPVIKKTGNRNKTGENAAGDIIHNHVIYAMTAGAIPVPLADFVAITAIQNDMIRQIAGEFGVPGDCNQGKTLASSIIGTSLAKIGASAVKAIPGIGTVTGIAAQVVLAGASTWALGRVFQEHFREKRSFTDFDLGSLKKQYRSLLNKGKEVARDLNKKTSADDVYHTIEKLKELHEKGAISEKEYESTRKGLLQKVVDSA